MTHLHFYQTTFSTKNGRFFRWICHFGTICNLELKHLEKKVMQICVYLWIMQRHCFLLVCFYGMFQQCTPKYLFAVLILWSVLCLCWFGSGGIERDWDGVPRKFFDTETQQTRCVCVRTTGPPSDESLPDNGNGDLGHPSLQQYEHCTPNSNTCHLHWICCMFLFPECYNYCSIHHLHAVSCVSWCCLRHIWRYFLFE